MAGSQNRFKVYLRGTGLASLRLRFRASPEQTDAAATNDLLARTLDTNTPAGMAMLLLLLLLLLLLIGANTLLVL